MTPSAGALGPFTELHVGYYEKNPLVNWKPALCEVVRVCRRAGTRSCANAGQNENGDFDSMSSAAASEFGVSIVTQRARVTRP